MMEDRAGSIVTLSYLGAERVVSNYNTMGLARRALRLPYAILLLTSVRKIFASTAFQPALCGHWLLQVLRL